MMGTVGPSYPVLVWFVRLVVNTFFRRIEVIGREHVPAEGPVIFAGNHPNALMDGFVVATRCGRLPVHFMGNGKLWQYRLMGAFLDALGSVPVYPRAEHGDAASHEAAFARLFQVLEAGSCMGIFPEGISHTGSQLARLKTGTARIALAVAARRKVRVTIVPCGLTYMHRHRFRSQALLHFGAPIVIDDAWLTAYGDTDVETVRRLTDHLAAALAQLTLNAPDWETLRFIHTARRLYKPSSARLTPETYVELSRRFVERYLATAGEPDMQRFRNDVERYQARLDLLGLRDHHLRESVGVLDAWKGVLWRSLAVVALLPLALPGALFHLPVGWVAMTAGERLSYDQDDVATLKVITVVLLLPVVYVGVGTLIGLGTGIWWGLAVITALPLSFLAFVKIVEIQANLTLATVTHLRLGRFAREVAELRATRGQLVARVREVADKYADRSLPRVFSRREFD
ncbi:MAG: lysophospholipid acyltransferase family protein [Vicinamibacterales bacterium]|jgi:1-acyl-sn-glycerol-3-phosphate acyltransferase|nr:lysophospholipid acyltransferase family protein [Vicinamibacterales bacterium]